MFFFTNICRVYHSDLEQTINRRLNTDSKYQMEMLEDKDFCYARLIYFTHIQHLMHSASQTSSQTS